MVWQLANFYSQKNNQNFFVVLRFNYLVLTTKILNLIFIRSLCISTNRFHTIQPITFIELNASQHPAIVF